MRDRCNSVEGLPPSTAQSAQRLSQHASMFSLLILAPKFLDYAIKK